VTLILAHAGSADETLSLVLIFAGLWAGWVGWSRLRDKGFPRLSRWAGWAAIVAGLGLIAAAATVPQAILGPTTSGRTGTRVASTASLRFLTPPAGTTVQDGRLVVSLDLEGGSVTDLTSTAVTPDTGHVHVSLDGSLVSMAGGTLQSIDVSTLDPGEHMLTAEFVAADHLPFDPPVTAAITFTVEGTG
jgi:hypothetical protein